VKKGVQVMVIQFDGDWTILKNMSNMDYVDFNCLEGGNYIEKMEQVHEMVMQALKDAQANGVDYVMFNYGDSASKRFIGTSKSIVKAIMRSKESEPFFIKKKSIQHRLGFVAAIKPKSQR
jgi:hypothetical protein